jgi:phage-related minor tail protein
MPNKFAEATQRNFDQMSTSKLSDGARKAVNAAFEAMSTWREEIANSEKNSEQVIDKMAVAARELGWPDQIVDATRMQMEAITKMQIQTMDRMMDTWEEQIKSPNSSSTMLSKLTSLPAFGPVGSWPYAGNPQMAALNPFQFYMQLAQQWQKTWADAMASWAKANTSSRA